MRKSEPLFLSLLGLLLVGSGLANIPEAGFRFAIIGDRTGGAVPGVYEEAWRETASDRPDFVINVGDSIQGGDDSTMNAEWQQFLELLAPYRHFRIFFTPGNHDIWSLASSQAYEKYSKRPPHYSFDYRQAHFVILDNSRGDQMPSEELAFLKRDLELHQRQPLKFVFSHRPSWILQTVLSNPQFPLHQIAKHYGVEFVIAGHIHQMLSFDLEGIRYLSMASAGGHLRASKKYEDGWFFAHSLAIVKGNSVTIQIKELKSPFGNSRVTGPGDWGPAGLTTPR